VIPRSLPLDGIHVLDASRVLAGPFAAMLLADLGADVIKLEPPGGDESRAWGPPWWGAPGNGRSAYFASVNRNKRSVVLDLRTDDGRAILHRLATATDLLFHNHRPTVAERLGLDAAHLHAAHPELVTVSIGSFPGDAAARERPAYDLLAQAVTGHMAITGEPGRGSVRMGVALLDLMAGLEAAVGALAALVRRGRAGSVDVSLVESGVTSLINVLGNVLATGQDPERWGSGHANIVPYQAFAASDGEIVIAVGNDAQFRRLLEALGLDDAEGRYATNPDRVARRDELVPLLAAAIGRRRRDEILEALAAADVPAGPVNTAGEALAAMEAAHTGRWLQERDAIPQAPDPILIDGERLPLRRAPPRLGEHTNEVLAGIGLDPADIRSLRERGVVG
jgi:crotonobetainyl-CoA:carnitine CoA-transferase CaiB-like acyl-CoA transferase